MSCYCDVVRDSSVGIATRYRLEGPGIESRWRVEIFRTTPDRPRPHQTSSTMTIGAFPRVKRPRLGAHHPSNTEFKERADLYLYFPSGPLWHILGRNLPLFLPVTMTDSFRFTDTSALDGGGDGAGGGFTPISHHLHLDF